MMSFVSVVLIALLHRQMAASDTAAAAARVSPHTPLMQALLDSSAALLHGVTALHFSALFNAFVPAAFLEALFALFELHSLLLLLTAAAFTGSGAAGATWDCRQVPQSGSGSISTPSATASSVSAPAAAGTGVLHHCLPLLFPR